MSNLGKKIKSLTYFVYKNLIYTSQKSFNKVFDSFQAKKIEKQKKINLALAITKYSNCLKIDLKSFLAASKSQIIFFTPFINHCRYLKKTLETQLEFITSTFFVNSFNIPHIRFSIIKLLKIGYIL